MQCLSLIKKSLKSSRFLCSVYIAQYMIPQKSAGRTALQSAFEAPAPMKNPGILVHILDFQIFSKLKFYLPLRSIGKCLSINEDGTFFALLLFIFIYINDIYNNIFFIINTPKFAMCYQVMM